MNINVYGALLNVGSRFFDVRLGQSVTLTGRSIVKHMSAQVNETIAGEYDHVGESVVYGDTDSVYFSAYPILKPQIDAGEVTWNKDTAAEFYDAVSDEVDKTFVNYMADSHNCPSRLGGIIKAGREIVGSRALFITKKRYAILVYDNEGFREDHSGKPGYLKAMGLDLKRSDTPSYMQEFLKVILMDALTGVPEEEIIRKVKDYREEFKKMPPWEMGTPKRVNKLTIYKSMEYDSSDGIERFTGKATMPGHVRAAINYNRLRKVMNDNHSMEISDGMKTIVCKLKDNPMGITSIGIPTDENRIPEWYKELPFDLDAMEHAIVTKKVKNLLGVLKWDLSYSKVNATFNSLFD